MKADDKVCFDDETKEEFSEFEYLKERVNQMEKVMDVHTDIFRGNDLELSSKTIAPYFNDDEVFRALAGE